MDMAQFAEAFSLPSVVAALVGGIIAGAGLAVVHPYPATEGVMARLVHHTGMLAWIGVLFYVGRFVGLAFHEDPSAARAVGVGLHWLMFVMAAAPGGYAVYRARRDQ